MRHIVATKRKDIRHIAPLLKAPFAHSSSMFCDEGSKDVSLVGHALGRYMIAARFANHPWIALYSNRNSAEELFTANAASRRLDVAWLGFRPYAGWFFYLHHAGKPSVEFVQAVDEYAPTICSLIGVKRGVLNEFGTGEQAVARLCEHFEISRSIPEIRDTAEGFVMVGVPGRPVRSGLRGYIQVNGPEIAKGEDAASTALAKAIDRGNPKAIRAAIEQGASLTALPGAHISPLLTALLEFHKPRWKECVEALLELGCLIEGTKMERPIVECVAHYIGESNAMKAVQLLVAHGANVNATGLTGNTALFECVVNRRVELVRFLMQHGADPTVKGRDGVSAIEWLREQHDDEQRFGRRAEYAELLGLVTGQPVAMPEAPTLSPALQAENNRFQRCVKAQWLLAVLPTNVRLKPLSDSFHERQQWHDCWQWELLNAGFLSAGHYTYFLTVISAFTNPHLGFDAILSISEDLGDKPRCEIAAYHADNTVTEVTNLQSGLDPVLSPPSLILKEFKGASPAQLIKHLQELLQDKPAMALDAATFADRYTETLSRLAIETRQRAQSVLETPSVLVRGFSPRYERLRFYLDFSSWDDPGYSTEKLAKCRFESFHNANREPPASLGGAIYAAMDLVAMRHFEFAGAPESLDFIEQASDLALQYFQHPRVAKGRNELIMFGRFEALLHGLLLSALAGRWETFKQICNAVRPKLASREATDDGNDFWQPLLRFVSGQRHRALPNIAALEQAVQKRLAKRPRLLLQLCRATESGQDADFDQSLQQSLKHFEERRKVAPRHREQLQNLALPESLFLQAALRRGLDPAPLPQSPGDLLITPESIGLPRVSV